MLAFAITGCQSYVNNPHFNLFFFRNCLLTVKIKLWLNGHQQGSVLDCMGWQELFYIGPIGNPFKILFWTTSLTLQLLCQCLTSPVFSLTCLLFTNTNAPKMVNYLYKLSILHQPTSATNIMWWYLGGGNFSPLINLSIVY